MAEDSERVVRGQSVIYSSSTRRVHPLIPSSFNQNISLWIFDTSCVALCHPSVHRQLDPDPELIPATG